MADPISLALANLADSFRLLVVYGVPAIVAGTLLALAFRAHRRERADEFRRY